jgi:nucleotide-binding universal stress UspA family protein
MKHFHHILFPVDFSERCRALRPFVRAIAARFNSKVTLLNVVQIPVGWYGGLEAGYPIMFDVPSMKAEAGRELSKFLQSSDGGVVDYGVTVGDPALEIARYAEINSVDLILMPTHGHGTFRGLLLGSVTAKVLHDVKCPVWTAAHTEDPTLAEHLTFNNVMCAIELDPSSPAVIREAVSLAGEFHAKLRLVHAVAHAESMPSAREEIAKMQADLGTNREVCMEAGPVSDVVRDACLHHAADLVILGRGMLPETFGRLRTNTYEIIRQAPCPVLSV